MAMENLSPIYVDNHSFFKMLIATFYLPLPLYMVPFDISGNNQFFFLKFPTNQFIESENGSYEITGSIPV